jgi:hypothetical protein
MEGETVPHINQNITFEDNDGNTQTGTILRTFRKGVELWYGVVMTSGEVVEIQRGQIVERQSRRVVPDTAAEEAERIREEIKASWTPEERERRWVGPKSQEWMPPVHKNRSKGRSLDYGE